MCVSVTLIPSLRRPTNAHAASSHAALMELALLIAADAEDMPITILGEDGHIAASFGIHAQTYNHEVELF